MRKYVDCRDFPSDNDCSLRISGREDEVLPLAYEHAIKVHGHTAGAELREAIRDSMRDEDDGIEGHTRSVWDRLEETESAGL